MVILVIFGLFQLWYLADNKDYFKADYRELSLTQQDLFKWKDDDNEESLKQLYRQHFPDSEYAFPRQNVTGVKLFRDIPLVSAFTSKTLKQDYVDNFVQFCNDTTNFGWNETTWQLSESKQYCRLYNVNGKVIGKIYFCLDNCNMTSAKPFSPRMKFGELSPKGVSYIKKLLSDNAKWE